MNRNALNELLVFACLCEPVAVAQDIGETDIVLRNAPHAAQIFGPAAL